MRSNGKSITATFVITLVNKDRMRTQIRDRTLGGAAVPGSESFFIVRKPPSPGK